MKKPSNLDELDKKILQILQANGRITNLQLSQEIGLSPAPTLERVRKLEKSGIIESYHARLDHGKLGYGLKVIIQVSLVRQIENAMHKFLSQIQDIPEIVECYQVTGEYDYHLKALIHDIKEFDALVNDKLSKIEEIGQMYSNVVLSVIKDNGAIQIN